MIRSNWVAWHFIKSDLKTSVRGGCADSVRELTTLTVLMVKRFLLVSSLNLPTLNQFGLDGL